MKRYFLCIPFLLIICFAQAQTISADDLALLKEKEQILKKIGLDMISSEMYEDRRDANYTFIQQFTNTLKIENSYLYDFPELKFIQKSAPTDDAFRIFSWQVEMQGQLLRHYGAIQMNSPELKLHPLVDRSDDMAAPENFVGDNTKWYGALYYQIIERKIDGFNKYLLLGLDANNPLSNKKVIDVLQFDAEQKPVFGAPIFANWEKPMNKATRFIIEYKGDAAVSMKYDTIKNQIVYDHLIPIDEANEGIFMNYVPDGTFDALNWSKSQFLIVENVVPTNYEELNQNAESQPKSNTMYKTNNK